MDIMRLKDTKDLVKTVQLLLLGQLVSLVLSLLSFTASLVASLGVNTPLTLSFSAYLAITLVYGSILLYRRQKLLVPWYWYLFLGFIDAQGNYMWGTKPLLGDTLVIMGTLCFAMSNVGQEYCVKKKDIVEFVSMIGIFGMLVSGCQLALLEKRVLESVKWSPEVILAFAGYALAGSLFYALSPFVLKAGGSTMFNLSLLTSDMWAVVIRIFFYRQQVDWLYYISFVMVVIGLVIYSNIEKDPVIVSSSENGDIDIQYQRLQEGWTESTFDSPALGHAATY
ncbi:uncharacterized protein LOC141720537 isoform X2 [Apium graveolens]|uniref:uncharacterized protein LOC141720537 isoform X2 n=1 Tax=Apium graveolens TaxID=4045 RepID=UPI003D795517